MKDRIASGLIRVVLVALGLAIVLSLVNKLDDGTPKNVLGTIVLLAGAALAISLLKGKNTTAPAQQPPASGTSTPATTGTTPTTKEMSLSEALLRFVIFLVVVGGLIYIGYLAFGPKVEKVVASIPSPKDMTDNLSKNLPAGVHIICGQPMGSDCPRDKNETWDARLIKGDTFYPFSHVIKEGQGFRFEKADTGLWYRITPDAWSLIEAHHVGKLFTADHDGTIELMTDQRACDVAITMINEKQP